MNAARNMLIALTVVMIFAIPAAAQDAGIPDTCRFDPTTLNFEINSLADSVFTLELWSWIDDANIKGASLPFKLTTSTGGGYGHDDSLIVVDTFIYDPGLAAIPVKTFGRSLLDESIDPSAMNQGYNGCLLGILSFFGPIFPVSTPTKIGDLYVKVLNPASLPCEFDIVVDSSFFPPAGAFKFSPTGGTGFPPEFSLSTVSVTNNLAPASPTIGLDPTEFTFNAVENGANPDDQILNITNTGAGTLNWSVSDDADWLALSPASGTGDGTSTLHVDITGLTANIYNATVTVSDPNATNDPQTAAVTLNISEPPPEIAVDPVAFYFEAIESGSNPASQTLDITNAGGGSLEWEAAFDATWLSLDPGLGTAPSTVTLTVDNTGLTEGIYYDTILISCAEATNSPVEVPVTFEITSIPTLSVDPTVLNFTATANGSNPDDQFIEINSTGSPDTELMWETINADAAWLSLNPTEGETPSIMTVSVDITDLPAGDYADTFSVIIAQGKEAVEGDTVDVEVLLTVEGFTPSENDSILLTDVFANSGDQVAMPIYLSNENPLLEIMLPLLFSSPDLACDSVSFAGGILEDLSHDAEIDNPNRTIRIFAEGYRSFIPAGGGLIATLYFTVDQFASSQVATVDTTYIPDHGVYHVSDIAWNIYEPYFELGTITITSTVPVIDIDPDSLHFTALKDGENPAPDTMLITNIGAGELNWTASYLPGSIFSATPESGTAPSEMEVTVDISGLAAGTYVDSVVITDPNANPSSKTALLVLEIEEPQPEIALDPNFFSFTMVENGSNPDGQNMEITNTGTGTLNWTLEKSSSWLVPSEISGTAPSTVTLNINGSGLAVDNYRDTVLVYGEGVANPTIAIVDLEVTEPPVQDLDTVWVGQASGLPGEQVVVPVTFKNIELLTGIDLPLTFSGFVGKQANGIICDSVSFIGTRVDYIGWKPVSIDSNAQTIVAGVIVLQEDLIPVGTGALAYMYFTIEPDAIPGIVPIDSTSFTQPDHELMFTDENANPIIPKFVAGQIEIMAPPQPCLEISEDYFSFTGYEGGPNPDDQYVDISNCGAGDLEWDIALIELIPAGTITFDPSSGINNATVTISVDISSLSVGEYLDTAWVTAEGAENSPQAIHIDITIEEPPATDIAGIVEDEDDLPIADAYVDLYDMYPGGSIVASDITDGDGSFLFEDMTGDYVLRVYKEGYYPTVMDVAAPDENVAVTLIATGEVTPTNEWINLYCDYATLDDEPIKVGDVIEAYDPDGVLCGQWFVSEEGKFGLMPVYRDDFTSGEDEGCDPGDAVTIKLNGQNVTPFIADDIIWAENGAQYYACFDAETVRTICMTLHEGWNLISWNVDTEIDDVETVISDIIDNVDIILSFEQGGLTYDPDLPEFSTLHALDHYHGYWFRMNAEVEFCVTGIPVDPSTPISLEAGWNLASYLPTEADSTPVVLASIYDKLIVVLGYDNGGLIWDPENPDMSDLRYLDEGFGYWMKVTEDATLTYPGGSPFPVYVTQPDNTYAKAAHYANVVPTTQWIDMYGNNVTIDGDPVAVGMVVEAVDENGTICGAFAVQSSGKFGFMPVYGDDASTSNITEGPRQGEAFHLVFDGVETIETFTWESNGDQIEVGALNSASGHNAPIPTAYQLHQNYPNPFNPTTVISYTLGNESNVSLVIYNILGEAVKVLVDKYQTAGDYSIEWNGTDRNGRAVSSGVYFYKLSTGNYTETKKMMLMK